MHGPFRDTGPDPLRLIRPQLLVVLASLTAAAFIAGCAFSTHPTRRPAASRLTSGTRAPGVADRRGGVALARRFARTYAAAAYRRRPAAFSRESASVRDALVGLASRVPRDRRDLRPHLLHLRLRSSADGAILATAWIGDDRRDRFSVGFTVAEGRAGWIVTTFSAPD